MKVLAENIWLFNGQMPELPRFSPQKRRERRPGDESKPSWHNGQPDHQTSNHGQQLVITLPAHLSKEVLGYVRDILVAHPGSAPVILQVPDGESIRQVTAKSKVNLTNELKEKLSAVLGRGTIH
jgi:hypothetical protein